jgi:hypothetical protein
MGVTGKLRKLTTSRLEEKKEKIFSHLKENSNKNTFKEQAREVCACVHVSACVCMCSCVTEYVCLYMKEVTAENKG